jgi:hypothetical protein
MNVVYLILSAFLPIVILSSCSTVKIEQKPLPPLSKKEIQLLHLMGGKEISNDKIGIGKIIIDRRTKAVSFPATVELTEGALEVLISTPKGRAYESLLVADINPYNLQLAMHLSGADNGARFNIVPPSGKKTVEQGDLFKIFIKTKDGKSIPVTDWLKVSRATKNFDNNTWVFVGSSFNSRKECMAAKDGNIVTTWSFGNTILDNPNLTGNTDDCFTVFKEKVPKTKTPVTVILKKIINNHK